MRWGRLVESLDHHIRQVRQPNLNTITIIYTANMMLGRRC
jgi:hypothetical protein